MAKLFLHSICIYHTCGHLLTWHVHSLRPVASCCFRTLLSATVNGESTCPSLLTRLDASPHTTKQVTAHTVPCSTPVALRCAIIASVGLYTQVPRYCRGLCGDHVQAPTCNQRNPHDQQGQSSCHSYLWAGRRRRQCPTHTAARSAERCHRVAMKLWMHACFPSDARYEARSGQR